MNRLGGCAAPGAICSLPPERAACFTGAARSAHCPLAPELGTRTTRKPRSLSRLRGGIIRGHLTYFGFELSMLSPDMPADNPYYMCTKYFADGDVHKYFNPYETPYDSYINFMNVLDNLRTRCRTTAAKPETTPIQEITPTASHPQSQRRPTPKDKNPSSA